MIRVQYQTEGKPGKRFVKKARGQGFYKWCVTNADDPRYDIAQGTCEPEDLPEHIREVCDVYNGCHYAIEWPFEVEV